MTLHLQLLVPVVGGVVLVTGLAVALGAGAELGFQIQSSQSVAAGGNGGKIGRAHV